jgi:polysaccharide deacetylase family protein (PEP-CTERM system associated)
MLNILTVDVEELYHAEYVKQTSSKYTFEDRSQNDLAKTLTLLKQHNAKATFFVVGELAQKHPELISQIKDSGNEIAFHSYYHESLEKKSSEAFEDEIDKFHSVIGMRCKGFRAPSFSVNNNTRWVLDVLEKKGFQYDSSIFPAKTPLYGAPKAPLKPYKPSHTDITAEDDEAQLWEFPLHTYPLPFIRVPMAGGFYLRFFPPRLVKRSIKKANKEGRPAVVFVHTWELNPQTPRLKLGLYRSFVTYFNLEKTAARMEDLLSEFKFTSVEQYMKEEGL